MKLKTMKYYYIIPLFFCLILVSQNAHADSNDLWGKLFDLYKNNPLNGANIPPAKTVPKAVIPTHFNQAVSKAIPIIKNTNQTIIEKHQNLTITKKVVNSIMQQNQIIDYTNKTQIKNLSLLSTSSLIGIQLSQECIRAEQNHIQTNCLTYDKLLPFDNTSPLISGKFINDTWFHRTNPQVKNHYQFYKGGLVMVDPDSKYTTLSKMIIVTENLPTYTNPDEMITDNHTRTEYSGVFFIKPCNGAILSDLSLLNKTINYIQSGCKNKDTITPTKSIVMNLKPFDMEHSISIKYNNYLKLIMNGTTYSNSNHTAGGKGPQDCIRVNCNFKDPFNKF